jgi:hypothetical protein
LSPHQEVTIKIDDSFRQPASEGARGPIITYYRKLQVEPSSHWVFPIALMTSVLPLGIDLLISPPPTAAISCTVSSRTSLLPALTVAFMMPFPCSIRVVQRSKPRGSVV